MLARASLTDRRGFAWSVAGLAAALTVTVVACGPARDDCTCMTAGAEATTISGNHGHALTIEATDFDAFADRNYQIKGTADHDHVVTYTAQQFQTLGTGGTAKATSTAANGHSHDVTIECACQ